MKAKGRSPQIQRAGVFLNFERILKPLGDQRFVFDFDVVENIFFRRENVLRRTGGICSLFSFVGR